MSKKRRVFDIDFDAELSEGAPAVPAGTASGDVGRRGPMATAISENAEAVQTRRDAERAIRAENDALAQELVRLKRDGLVTDVVPVDQIDCEKLVRDRAPGRDPEIDELKRSILELGLSNPIRVEQVGDRYELIQGYRRLTAFRELAVEEGAPYHDIPAVLNARRDDITVLYRRMVDENLVRRGVSFGELAQLAISYAEADPEIATPHEAVEAIYASTSRQKRSHIRSFVDLLGLLDGALEHPEAIPRALGQDILRRLQVDGPGGLRADLLAVSGQGADDQLAVLKSYLKQRPDKEAQPDTAKTSLRMTRPEGIAKCIAAPGRVDIRLDKDFSAIERTRLEQALSHFLDLLDD